MHVERIALDKSTRSYDAQGRLHVSVARISKANVCPYYGWEIPNSASMGLDDERVYHLYRDPRELDRAAATSNLMPVQVKHVPTTAERPRPDIIVGSTGTDGRFQSPYLLNSLVIWDAGAIAGVEDGEQQELSWAYHYDPDMTPGTTPGGVRYDGVMRNMRGNHVALVSSGRAGPEMIVGDSKLKPRRTYAMALSRTALMTSGALRAYALPRLAQDARMPDLRPIVEGVTTKNWRNAQPVIMRRFARAFKGRLAQDARPEDLARLLHGLATPDVAMDAMPLPDEGGEGMGDTDSVDPSADPGGVGTTPPPDDVDSDAMDEDAAAHDRLREFLKGKLSDEDIEQACAMLKPDGAIDAEAPSLDMPEPLHIEPGEGRPGLPTEKPAMDAMIKGIEKRVREEMLRTTQEIVDAKEAVRPYVGEQPMAMDSAFGVYRRALEDLGVDVAGINDIKALKLILKAQPKPGAGRRDTSLAMDAASAGNFEKRFPTASNLRIV